MSGRTSGAQHLPTTNSAEPPPYEGRVFGGIVLAAFLLYGIGSAMADQPIGLALVGINSIAVALAGIIGFRLVRASSRSVGLGYLAARIAEGVLLLGGILMAELADLGGADTTGYLLAMSILSVGSIPFLMAARRVQLLPQALATWGIYGYASLAIGALLELLTGRSLAVVFAVPGGLFELVLGLRLIWQGFESPIEVSDQRFARTKRSVLDRPDTRQSSQSPG